MKLWMGNIDPDATDDDLRALLRKYTRLELSRLTRVPGDGSRPGAMLEFDSGDSTALYDAQRRLNGMYWKNRSLTVQVLL